MKRTQPLRVMTANDNASYKIMTVNDSKSYLSYLNKLVDQYNNTCHHSIDKKCINADYSALTAKTETNPKASKFKVGDSVKIT